MSSMKLIPATRVTAIRNQIFRKPKKAAQIQRPRTKMIPPPRSTMLLCEERWFGLSMMLKRSAMRKYTNSAARSRAEIIKYISQVFISIFVFVARKAHLFRGGSYHTETIAFRFYPFCTDVKLMVNLCTKSPAI